MSEKKKSTEKQADPKYPPETDPEDFDPDEEESWPDVEEKPLIAIKKKKR